MAISRACTSSSATSVPANQITPFDISLEDIWGQLSLGTLEFKVRFNGKEKNSQAIEWKRGDIVLPGERIMVIDLRRYNNIDIRKLYGYDFKWRADYTGTAAGVDWRDTLRIDDKGYRLFVPPVCLISYVLPEIQILKSQWLLPDLPEDFDIPVPFPFFERKADVKNTLALVNVENNASIPGEAIIKLAEPTAIEKIYLLTANLTKTCKSYYPGAEVVIKYDTGDDQVIQLIPPYTMSSFNQPFCVSAYHIPWGRLNYTQTMIHLGENTGLSLSDLVLDPERKVIQISLRCVSTETVFGVLGMNLLKRY